MLFVLTWNTPWLQLKVVKYLDFAVEFNGQVPLSGRISSKTDRSISLYSIPIKCRKNVEVHHALCFDHEHSMTSINGHETHIHHNGTIDIS